MKSIFEVSIFVVDDRRIYYPSYKCSKIITARFSSLKQAEEYIGRKVEEYKKDNLFCFYIDEYPIDDAEYEYGTLSTRLYDEKGILIDKTKCSDVSVGTPESEFYGRTSQEIRFNRLDIVEVLGYNNEVSLAYIVGTPITQDEIRRRGVAGDYTDERYTILTSNNYNSHDHVSPLYIFKPHFRIPTPTLNRFKRMIEEYEADRIKNGYNI